MTNPTSIWIERRRLVALAVAIWLTPLIAQEPTPTPTARELLERTASAYRAMSSYRDVIIMREELYPGGDDLAARVMAFETVELVMARPDRLRMVPGARSYRGDITADGEHIWITEAGGGRYATLVADGNPYLQLGEVELASIVWLSIPALFFFVEDALGSLVESYGEVLDLGRLERGAAGDEESVDVVRFALGGGASVELELDSASSLVSAARITEPIVVEGSSGGRRVVEILFRARRADFGPGEDYFRFEPAEGAQLVDHEALVAATLKRTMNLGEELPDFTVPAAKKGEEPLAPEQLRGEAAVIAFVQTWGQGATELMSVLSELATGTPPVRVTVVALDEDPDAASGRLAKHEDLAGYLDPGGMVAASLGIADPLVTLVLDPLGHVRAIVEGAHGAAELRELVERARGN